MPQQNAADARFTPEQLTLLRDSGVARRWRLGEVLLAQGTPSTEVILVGRGLVKVTADTHNGYTSMLALRGPGDLLGELSCVDGRPRSATARAAGEVTGTAIGADEFRRLLTEEGGLALTVLRCVAGRLRDADRLRSHQGAYRSEERVGRVLLELARRYGSPHVSGAGALELPITQYELAGAAGTSRESTSRALRTLQDTGLVARARGRVVLPVPDRLARWLAGPHARG
ncbi:Crp/Fnr family transcriptional regulator [Streptomyces sp. MUM 203J]|uniref:Crp/Fnr family transcriptional regulator n=1 Tax=Streptomyces sp. MUM 203J TaxID=2791990 RepID=UPI001F04078F|nr:Crp/Fnr family transcriptional regulator [Streptomyces sp. MUM 203J]